MVEAEFAPPRCAVGETGPNVDPQPRIALFTASPPDPSAGLARQLKPDGEFEVISPWGHIHTTRPPGHTHQPVLPIDQDPEALAERMNVAEEHFEALLLRDIIQKRLRGLVAA